MKRIVLLFAFMSLGFVRVSAQAVQQGTVVEMNSDGRPIEGVEVIAVGAIPADSDSEGKFRLVFSRAAPGARVVASRIHKEGYEIVNDVEINGWILSEKVPFKIVMCRAGKLEESRRNFYDIGRDRYYTLYEDARKRLEHRKNEMEISEQQFADSLENILTLYEANMRRLDYYADKFSRINRDELGELDARALELMERGEVDEAIAVYEEAGILRIFREKTAQSDTLSSNIAALTEALARQIGLLLSKDGPQARAKADSLLTLLEERRNADDRNTTAVIAEFRMSMGQYDRAYELLSRELPACRDRETGEKIAGVLIRAARALDQTDSGARLGEAQTIVAEWRRNRTLRTIDD